MTLRERMYCPVCGEYVNFLKFSFNIVESSPVIAEVNFVKEKVVSARALPKTINIDNFQFYCVHCSYDISRLITKDEEDKFVELVMSIAKLKDIVNGKRGEEDEL